MSLRSDSNLLPYPRGFAAEVERPEPAPEPSLGDDLRQAVVGLARSWRIILLATLTAIVLMIAFIWVTPPLYGARAELLVDPRQKQILSGQVTPTGLGSSALGADTLLLDSQVQVIRSQSVLGRVVREEGLIDDPEFIGSSDGGASPLRFVKDLVKSVIYGPNNSRPEMTPFDRALTTLTQLLRVRRESNTYVITISMLSKDPEKSARIANRIADLYVAETSSAVSRSTMEAADTLGARLDELRTAAEAADREVEAYRAANGLIGAQDVLLVEQQLRDLNAELGRARLESEAARADLQDAELAAGPNGIDTGRLQSIESPVMAQLLVQLAQLDAQFAEMRARLLPSHPDYLLVLERRAALVASITDEHGRIIDRLRTRYNVAVEKERSIEAGMKALERDTATSNLAAVRLRELERKATASRQVYEEFLRRSKEASEQVGLPSSTARVISAAYPSSRPDFPQVPLLLAAAAAMGLMLGVAIAWLRHILGRPPSRRERFAA